MRQAGISGPAGAPARQDDDPCPGRPRRGRPRRAPLPARSAECALGRGRDLSAHLGGVALPRCCPRRVLAPDRRLEHGRPYESRACRRRIADGDSRADDPRPGSSTTQTRAVNTSHSDSARPLARPASRARWAHAATATTTPSPKASSPPSKKNSSTATHGRPDASSRPPSSTTSKRSRTRVGDTPRSGCSPRPNSRRKPPLTTTKTKLESQARECPRKRGKSRSEREGAERLHRSLRRPDHLQALRPPDAGRRAGRRGQAGRVLGGLRDYWRLTQELACARCGSGQVNRLRGSV